MLGYIIVVLFSSMKGSIRIKSFRMTPILFLLFIVEHFTYLFGLFYGVFLGPWSKVKQREPVEFKRYMLGLRESPGVN